jgi:integrase
MRPRKPWFRANRDAWYVQHNGKQVLLAKGKASKAEAQAAYHRLMLESGESPARASNLPVATLCDLFLDYSQVRVGRQCFENYRRFLSAFCQRVGRLHAGEVKPFHVTSWVDAQKSWNGGKRHAIVAVKRAFSWAEQQGLIAVNPLRWLKAPRANTRERVLSTEERKLILGEVRDEAFRSFLLALLGTGARPSEVAGVTAAQVNLDLGVWVLAQHKMAKKTGKPRIVYLSPEMLALTQAQMSKHSTGPLFPNLRGRPFDRNAWRCRFRRLRDKFPQLKCVVAYSCRHSYATDALINGVGIAQVAELMGHSDASMVARVYGHIAQNTEHMRQAAARATRSDAP